MNDKERVWCTGDWVCNKAVLGFFTATLVTRGQDLRLKPCWIVSLGRGECEGQRRTWLEENLLPEPPLEALARVGRDMDEGKDE